MTRYDLLTLHNLSQSITDWALDYGIPPDLIIERLRTGKSIEEAVTLPMKVRRGDRLKGQYLLNELSKFTKPGVVCNLTPSKGTGAGSTAQEIPEITFSDSEVSQ